MKKIWIILLLTMATHLVNAQINLVPNPSFEDTVTCPDHGGNIDQASGWINCGITPDYFNVCANISFPSLGVPDGFYSGYQFAFNGNGYAAIETYEVPIVQHEFIGIQLLQPLVIGTKYYASCYVSRSDYYICAANNFGFRFFMSMYFSNIDPAPIDNFSHIHSNIIINDTINWVRVEGSFVADSAYQYLVVGNFYDNLNTSIFNCDTTGVNGAYYLVDAVCVSTDSATCNNWVGIKEVDIKGHSIYPNPAYKSIQVDNLTEDVRYSIVNSLGEIVASGCASKKNSKVDISSFENGLYILAINNRHYYKFIKTN